ncbi:hypothetical protein GMI68_03615 [Eggerthellaceae bacterium zg-886]|uniref:Uncharacterized protein n=2 Tax=Xiamenia xianingshaonis TaxID=2682776 RepID=A0A9E6MR25_9ACTN|nr:hypothetical protein [Xiamenia xianingshaonis]QTU84440.1 hypothetical protein J7S26_00420 [Xiamenia xianingshaonis]
MKKTMSGNMYSVPLDEAWETFAAHLDGARAGVFLVVSKAAVGDGTRAALTATARSLDYGDAGATFARIEAEDGAKLDAKALFSLVEGVDPLVVVAVDGTSAALLGETYRTDVVLERPGRLFGRPLAAFADFEACLADQAAKQRAWHVLKSLPKYTGK